MRTPGYLPIPGFGINGCRRAAPGRARNHGIAMASADLFVFTDDDCIVPRHWTDQTRHRFASSPDLALFFGAVKAPQCDDGWIAEFHPLEDGAARQGSQNIIRRLGLLANMAVRRTALERIGPFDELLGAGAVFSPANDTDYGLRSPWSAFRTSVRYNSTTF